MRTPTILCLLLSLGVSGAQAQVAGSSAGWRVDAATQRERDSTRKSILDDELASEARQFTDARNEWREARTRGLSAAKTDEIAERLDRHRRNIISLVREIAPVEGNVASAGVAKRPVERTTEKWLVPRNEVTPSTPVTAQGSPAERGRPDWIIPGREAGKLQ